MKTSTIENYRGTGSREMDSKKTICIVEDDRLTALMISKTLEKLGYSVPNVFPTGEELIEQLEDSTPDLLILDIVLSGTMDGIETARVVRERFSIPVVFLTSHNDFHLFERAWEIDPYGYLLKPIDRISLYTVIETAFNRFNLEMKLKESGKRYQSVVNDQSEIITRWLPDGTCTFMNVSACRFFGGTPDENIGKNLFDKLTEYDRELFLNVVKTLNADNPVEVIDYNSVDNSGLERNLILSVRGFFNENGDLIEIQSVARDVTERVLAERERIKLLHDMGERVKELRGLYAISTIMEDPSLSIEAIMTRAVEVLPNAWQYPENTCARINLNGADYTTDNYRDTEWKQSAEIKTHGKTIGLVEVCYLEEKPLEDEGPFLAEERSLINAIAENLGRNVERKKSEKGFREQYQFMETLLDTMPNPVFYKDREGRYIGCNRAFEEFFGKAKDDIIGKKVGDVFPDNPAETFKEKDEDLFEKAGKQFYETRLRNSRGEERDIAFSKATFQTLEGKTGGIIGIMLDITEQKRGVEKLQKAHDELEDRVKERTLDLLEINDKLINEINEKEEAEEALRASEDRYRRFVESMEQKYFFYSHDTGGVFTYVSPSITDILGYGQDEFLNHFTTYLTDNPVNEYVAKYTEGSLKGIQQPPFEVDIYRKDGSICRLEVVEYAEYDNEGNISGIQGIAGDITGRIEAEHKLKEYQEHLEELVDRRTRDLSESEEKYRLLTENIPVVVYSALADDFSTTTYLSEKVHDLTGYRAEEFLENPKLLREIIVPEDRDYVWRNIEKLRQEKSLLDIEYCITTREGETKFVRDRAVPVNDENGKMARIDGYMEDITERKKAEDELRKFKVISDKSNYGSAITDLEGNLLYINEYFAGVHGFTTEELIEENLAVFHNENQLPHVKRLISELIARGSSDAVEVWHTGRDGSVFPMLMSAVVIKDENENPLFIAASALDITEKMRTEVALARESDINASMARLSRKIIELADIDELSNTFLEDAKRFTGSVFGYVGYIEESTGHLICPTMTREIWDVCQVPDKDIVFREFGGLWGWVLENRQSVISNSPSEDPRSSGTPEGHIPVEKVISVPAMFGDTLLGQISLANPRGDYRDEDLDLIERYASLYAIGVKRLKDETALVKSEREYRDLYESMRDGFATVDMDGTIINCNPEFERIVGYTLDELTNLSYRDLTPEKWHEMETGILMEQVIARGYSDLYEKEYIRKDGSIVSVELRTHLIKDDEGNNTGMWAIVHDISTRKMTEKFRKLTSDVLTLLNQTVSTGKEDSIRKILVQIKNAINFDAVGIRIREGNDYPYFESSGFTDEFIKAENSLCITGPAIDNGSDPELACLCGAVINQETRLYEQFKSEGGRFWTNNGEIVLNAVPNSGIPGVRGTCFTEGYESVALIPLRSGEEIIGMLQLNDRKKNRFSMEMIRFFEGIGQSIGIAIQRNKAEERIRSSLKEKEILLREVHHRVKNNMQSIASIIRLGLGKIDDEKNRSVYRDIENRIRTMGLIHEMLYRTDNLASINFADYVRDLSNGLFSSFGFLGSRVTASIEIDNIHLDLDTAIPCGLLINELITNSLKYAFPDGREGKITVAMKRTGENFELTVSDNGTGMPEDLDIFSTGTLGFSLVMSWVNLLDGTIELSREKGTSYTIKFKELDYGTRNGSSQ